MRQTRDTVFIAVLILSVIASTSLAILTATGAFFAPGGTSVTVVGGGTAGATPGSSGSSGSSGSAGGPGGGQTNGVTGGTITVGAIYSESGGIDATVEQHTVEACFNYYNAQGGINGHKLRLVSYDDNLNANNAYNDAVRLDAQDHVFAIVGWLAPFGEASAAPYFESKGIPIVGGLGVPQEFGSPYSFPVSPIFQTDGYAFGAYATNPGGPLKFKHPGVFVTQTAGIQDFIDGIKQGAARYGVNISNNDIVQVSFAAPQPTFQGYLAQFQADGVDGLITQIDPFSYTRLYAAEEGNRHIFPHLGGAGLDKQSVDAAIGQPLNGTYGFMPYLEAQGNPGGNGEVGLYNSVASAYIRTKSNDSPANMDAFSEGSWVACRVFAQALAKLGPNVTRQGLVQALNSGTYSTGGMAPDFNWGASGGSHAAANAASFIEFTGGRWVIVQSFAPIR
ncbi:MAG TPA: ABC transporter substrate-binding protein [Ktedonobacterales bacterium]|nr:ABC transporter substrate-binding protein [Ktedonobacterales bacterium]